MGFILMSGNSEHGSTGGYARQEGIEKIYTDQDQKMIDYARARLDIHEARMRRENPC